MMAVPHSFQNRYINELTDDELNVTHDGILPILLTIAITTLIAHPAY
jgi:hypothetical protein